MRALRSPVVLVLLAAVLAVAGGCRRGPAVVAEFPVDSLDGVLDREAGDLILDREESADGRGSLSFESVRPRAVRLYEVASPRGVAGRRIVLTAKMRSLGVRGYAYPQLWVHLADGRDVQASEPGKGLVQVRPWRELRAVYECGPGERPERLRVDAMIDGIGRVWIDDIRIITEPLE